MSAYAPLFDPDRPDPDVYSLEIEILTTRQILDETASLNIYSDRDMLQAAVALNARARALLAAIEAERGERRG